MTVMTEAPGATQIRPFQVTFADGELDDLKRRVSAARLPGKELVLDRATAP